MKYLVTFHTTIEVQVTIDADDEDLAGDEAWPLAQEYLDTVLGDHRDITASASLDGIGADEVEEARS